MKENVIVFGTGEYFKIFKNIIENKFNIIGFADNDVNKHNKYFDRKKVINPIELYRINYDKIFIASTYEMEIEKQLINMGVSKEKIISSKQIIDSWFKIDKIRNEKKYNRINLLFCIRDLSGGGAQRVLIDLLNNLDYDKYSVDLLCIYNDEIYLNQINKNVKVHILFKSKIESICGGNYIRRMNAEELHYAFIDGKYDIEIAFLEGEATKIIAGSDNETKKLAWVHTNMEFNHWTKLVYKNADEETCAYKRFSKIICDSMDVEQSVRKLFDIEKSNIKVIHTIIEKNNIIKLSNADNVTLEHFTFCAVGRITKVKGFDRLIKVHKKLIDEGIIHKIIVIGEGNDKNKLEHLVDELGLEKSFKFIGFKKNPYKYMKASDAIVIPSREEGLSTVICESLVLGKTIVATNCSGVVELIGDNKFGIVTDNSELGLYEGMEKILLNDELKSYYEKMSLEKAQEFNNKKIIEQIELLF